LIAQTYISSHPASGLILISPSPSTSSQEVNKLLPTPIEEFNYEAKFPLLVVDTPTDMKRHQAENRLVRDDDVEVISIQDVDGQEAFRKIETWLDQSGF
jgi:hypothetical protein